MNLQPTRIQRETVERWLPENLLSIVKDFEDWHIIATDIPEGLARSNATVVKEIQTLQIESMQLLSLSQSVLQIVVETVVGLSIYVNANDYKKSQEVRDWVGYDDQEFQGCYIDFDADVTLSLELELLKEPPMVISHRLSAVFGGYGSMTIAYK